MAMNLKLAHVIASLFDLSGPVEVFDFPEKGNINRESYLVSAGSPSDRADYILQKLNSSVFKKPAAIMHAMIACIEAQRKAISEGALQKDEEWEAIRLIPTREGALFLETAGDDGPSCWRMMARIAQTRPYKSLREIPGPRIRLQAAEEAGRGLALFGTLTAGMNPLQTHCPLPGYRDTDLYFDQLFSVLAGNRAPTEAISFLPADPELRQSTEEHFLIQVGAEEYRRRLEEPLVGRCIDLALEHKSHALKLAQGLRSGDLKTVVIHGDTKLENFLFSNRTGKAIALVDLDTIMPHTWLSDWGDMARSLINPAGERETDLARVTVDLEVFKSAARGFLSAARHTTDHEVALMADAVQIMSLELGVRFLADYLRGDTYFRLGSEDSPNLNKTRALVQFRLFENVRANTGRIESIIADCFRKRPQASRL
jgi:hypothetical protein